MRRTKIRETPDEASEGTAVAIPEIPGVTGLLWASPGSQSTTYEVGVEIGAMMAGTLALIFQRSVVSLATYIILVDYTSGGQDAANVFLFLGIILQIPCI